jgi:hypothetical protein
VWHGWHRYQGRGQRWRVLVKATTWSGAWDALLVAYPRDHDGECWVGRQGEEP